MLPELQAGPRSQWAPVTAHLEKRGIVPDQQGRDGPARAKHFTVVLALSLF